VCQIGDGRHCCCSILRMVMPTETSFGHRNVAMDAKVKLDTDIPTCRVGTCETVAMFDISWNDKVCRLQKWYTGEEEERSNGKEEQDDL
jgi:hypothetical protein